MTKYVRGMERVYWYRGLPVMIAMLAGVALIYSRTIHVPISTDLLRGVEVDAGFPWDEAIASWTMPYGESEALRIELKPEGASSWYTMGVWSAGPESRYSVKDQKDDLVEVQTDTLALKAPSRRVSLKLSGSLPKSFTLSFANRAAQPESSASKNESWGRVLDVPQRCQGDYPNGSVICSATSTSMILAYWGQELKRPILDEGVVSVCAGVYDPNWGGTGNWAFNMAYAGSRPGMNAFVARLWNLGHLEQLVGAGFPVACSVSYDLLKGLGKKGARDGHLVVVVGFTENGDPVFNDPGKREVRLIYKRSDFEAAWASSGRTCYIVHPSLMTLPESPDEVW